MEIFNIWRIVYIWRFSIYEELYIYGDFQYMKNCIYMEIFNIWRIVYIWRFSIYEELYIYGDFQYMKNCIYMEIFNIWRIAIYGELSEENDIKWF